ncbi:hypothetical protein E3T26_06950 [Cryobacterium sp. TMT1-21]|uniref:hypothetical protein n=1 Tax=Cryobacterium sp. TMT1-21 TaxID=1259234 RepID=UPI00106D46F4|nr:hypothetical protein [Cryobacterium sp. TMT1-21]TFD15514.1 hypothetical protein E3T26_06950 [Cryobacterium sp. TMT1-21]
MSERIVAAAIQHSGVVFTGRRHGLIMQQMVDLGFIDVEDRSQRIYSEMQGFLTSENRWVNRKEGMQIAIDANQLDYKEQFPELFSEDLW